MTYGKISGLLVLGLILTAFPESLGLSYFFLFATLGGVVYLWSKYKVQLEKPTFYQKIYRFFCYFFFFWLSVLIFTLPDVKEDQKLSREQNIQKQQEKTQENSITQTGEITAPQTPEPQPASQPIEQQTQPAPQEQQAEAPTPAEPQPATTPVEPIEEEPIQNSNFTTYALVKVVDGDTITIKDNNGKKTKVRMIGLDTPESNSARYGYIECYGAEASQHLKSLLQGASQIQLETDSTQTTTDKYGRSLGYVRYNGINLNQKMIEDGYGFEYTYNLPYKYQSQFKAAQRSASENRLGLWADSACAGDRKKGTQAPAPQQPTPAPQVEAVAPQEQAIISSSERVYHRGRRGGCYYITASGGKEYVDHAFCGG